MLSPIINRLLTLAVILALYFSSAAAAKKTPNIIIYMADDLGYGSIGAYGANPSLVRTPNIDNLTESGLKFTQAYTTASVCSPTRYAMLTGRYSWRSRLQYGVVNSHDPLLIESDIKTMPAWLQVMGYETAHFGKWHLGYKAERFENLLGKISPGPNEVGFDYHFGVPNNMDDIHKVYIENDRIFGLRSDRISPYGKSFYGKVYSGYDAPQRNEPEVMAEITQRAIQWLDERNSDKPFFMYFAAVAVHHPIMPSPRMLGTSQAGAYGDFIHDLDYSVGQLVDALDHRGIRDNTLIIFVSDNGGDIPSDPMRPERQAQAQGLAINGTLRGDKHTIYEGGIRSPMIASWPQMIQGGESTEAFVTTADIFSTLADVLNGNSALEDASPDGFSFANVLKNPAANSDRNHGVFRDANGRKAVRFGPWKYIDNYSPRVSKTVGNIELYNLSDDPSESNNIADQHPEFVKHGKDLLKKILGNSAD